MRPSHVGGDLQRHSDRASLSYCYRADAPPSVLTAATSCPPAPRTWTTAREILRCEVDTRGNSSMGCLTTRRTCICAVLMMALRTFSAVIARCPAVRCSTPTTDGPPCRTLAASTGRLLRSMARPAEPRRTLDASTTWRTGRRLLTSTVLRRPPLTLAVGQQHLTEYRQQRRSLQADVVQPP